MDKTYESIEKTLIFLMHHKNWSDFQGENLKRALDLYDSGFMIVSKDLDSLGRRVVICKHEMDLMKFNSDDVFRLMSLVFSTLFMDEETQVGGVVYINDARRGTLHYVAALSLKSMYEYSVMLKSVPMRVKRLIMVGLPGFGTQLFNVAKSTYSEKLKKRIEAISDISELKNHVQLSVLPQEYGGTFTTAELKANFKPKMIEHAKYTDKFYSSFSINFSKVSAYKDLYDNDMIGTFRKLEID